MWDQKGGQFECGASLEGHENEVGTGFSSTSWNLVNLFNVEPPAQGEMCLLVTWRRIPGNLFQVYLLPLPLLPLPQGQVSLAVGCGL